MYVSEKLLNGRADQLQPSPTRVWAVFLTRDLALFFVCFGQVKNDFPVYSLARSDFGSKSPLIWSK